jgi:hypothetical protein
MLDEKRVPDGAIRFERKRWSDKASVCIAKLALLSRTIFPKRVFKGIQGSKLALVRGIFT